VEVSTSEQVRRTRTKLRLTEKELANLSPRYPLPNSQPYPSLLEQIAHHPRPPIPYLKPNDPYSNNWASAPLPVPSQT